MLNRLARVKVCKAPAPALAPHRRPWTELPCPGGRAFRTTAGLTDGALLGFCDVCGRAAEVVKSETESGR